MGLEWTAGGWEEEVELPVKLQPAVDKDGMKAGRGGGWLRRRGVAG